VVPPEVVLELGSILSLKDHAFLVGGQALNLWAERYSSASELKLYGPYTSKDIDYFGHREAAKKLADALHGEVAYPTPDDMTPHTAIVTADVAGQHLIIDFIDTVLGVQPNRLEKRALEITAPIKIDGETGTLLIPVMHPLHCFQSRIANRFTLRRSDDLAERQLQASVYVVREYLREMLSNGQVDEAIATIRDLFGYLKSDVNGRKAWSVLKFDPISIFGELSADPRLDERYRGKTVKPMVERLKRVRSHLWPKIAEGVFLEEPEEA
jgi:hypothetical protein